jgi:aspartyl protease family protein
MIIAAWVVLLGLLTWLFDGWLEGRHNPNRNVAVATDARGDAVVELQRNRAGHYVATGAINGSPVVFLLDTGATDVAVPAPLAGRLGLKRGRAVLGKTANGVVKTWQTRLDSVRLGAIELNDVRATIMPNMPGDDVLLGMSFLKQLEFVQRDGVMRLRQTTR